METTTHYHELCLYGVVGGGKWVLLNGRAGQHVLFGLFGLHINEKSVNCSIEWKSLETTYQSNHSRVNYHFSSRSEFT